MYHHYYTAAAALLAVAVPSLEAKNDGLVKTPPMGWNSWNHFKCDISEDLIKETALAIQSSGLQSLGYEYINLDDCWQASERDEEGKIQPDATRFPSGMKALGDFLHERGFKFGIYSSAGFKTCQAFPASLGREEVDAQVYASWGVDFLKYDNCFTDYGEPEKRYPPMSDALVASGRPIVYSLCEWGRANPAAWGEKIAHLWRVSGDIRDTWRSLLTRAAISAPLWRYAGPGGWNDPDMLEVGNGGCSFEEYKTHFSFWAMLKAPLIVGNDVRAMTKDDEAYAILSNAEVIAVDQDSLGWQARRIWSDRSEHHPVFSGRGDRLIATKCARSNAGQSQQDALLDQQWTWQQDGTIVSHATGLCLAERAELAASGEEEDLLRSFEGAASSLSELDFSLGEGRVTTDVCANATRWDLAQRSGGALVSRESGRCLEVAANPIVIFTDGKRVRTAPCMPEVLHDKKFVNIREHQGWTQPSGVKGAQLMNLYQRQCLTIDRDAPLGLLQEVWSTSLATGELAVMLLNKGPTQARMSVAWQQLGLAAAQVRAVRDLWAHAEVGVAARLSAEVPSHGVALFKISVRK